MKQRRIKELSINHYEQGASVAYTPSREEEYASVLAQAEAHQDLRFHMESDGVETLVILPWDSVIGVYATYETADVAAPTDAICGEVSRLKVTPSVYTFNNVTRNGVMVELSADMPAASDFVSSVTYDGEEVDGWSASVDGLPDNTEQVGEYPVTVTVTYNGETQTFDATFYVRFGFG